MSGQVAAPPRRQRELGARLRRVRSQQGLSLAQVEAASDGRWKAVVVGAYERGDRAVTIERLASLATFYGVPLAHLLPAEAPASPERPGTSSGVLLDVAQLEAACHDDGPVGDVARFATGVRLLRGDHGARVLTVREADVATIALAAGMAPELLHEQLDERGLSVVR